jgi:hypothetical protein
MEVGQGPNVGCSPKGEKKNLHPDHSGRAAKGMSRLRPLEHCDRGFESQSRHGCICVRLFCVCVVVCAGSGLATG